MSRDLIMEQYVLIDRIHRYTEKGWRFEPKENRVKVTPPPEVRERFGLVDNVSWIAGASFQEALAFVDGYTECFWVAKRKRTLKP